MSVDAAAARFSLTPDQEHLLGQADDFARKRLAPLAQRMDDEEWWPPELFADMGRHGMLGATIGADYGGAGMSLLEAGLVVQAFALESRRRAEPGRPRQPVRQQHLPQRRRHAAAALSAEAVLGPVGGLPRPDQAGAGSDALRSMRTRAVRDGDVYRITGSKLYITNGPIADVCLLYAKTIPDRGSKGITAFVVDTATPDSRWRRSWSRWASGDRRPPSWSSTTWWFRPPTSSAPSTRGTGW